MATGNKTRFPLLGLLTWGPASGYDLKQRIEKSLGNFWSESFGQIYPVLKELQAEGMVQPRGDSGSGQRPRTVYALTEAGRTALEAWLGEPAMPQPPRLEVLLKLFFGRHVPTAVSRAHLEATRAEHAATLTRYEAQAADLRARKAGHPDLPYWLLTLDYGLRNCRAMLEWCDAALAALPAGRDEGEPTTVSTCEI
jgi:DNA-binding PadR family transcriptional regulator